MDGATVQSAGDAGLLLPEVSQTFAQFGKFHSFDRLVECLTPPPPNHTLHARFRTGGAGAPLSLRAIQGDRSFCCSLPLRAIQNCKFFLSLSRPAPVCLSPFAYKWWMQYLCPPRRPSTFYNGAAFPNSVVGCFGCFGGHATNKMFWRGDVCVGRGLLMRCMPPCLLNSIVDLQCDPTFSLSWKHFVLVCGVVVHPLCAP